MKAVESSGVLLVRTRHQPVGGHEILPVDGHGVPR
jgi:hypothetical protein